MIRKVLFDARDVLERNSKNVERMTAHVDKMYIKLDQKDVSYKLQIYQKRGRGQNRENFRQNNNNWRRKDHLVEKEITIVIEVMDEVEVISEEVVFEVRTVVILEEIIAGIEIEKIEGLGDNQDHKKEE